DVILDVNGKAVSTPADVRRAVSEAQSDGKRSVLMRVKSGQGTHFVAVALGHAGNTGPPPPPPPPQGRGDPQLGRALPRPPPAEPGPESPASQAPPAATVVGRRRGATPPRP